MTIVHEAWLAGNLIRWHANPIMNVHRQTVAEHSAGMAVLLISLFPDWTKNELRACITHDLGEMGAGCDMAGDKKRANPVLAELIASAERESLEALGLAGGKHSQRVEFVDKLEAYKFVELRAPECLKLLEWRDARAGLVVAARLLGLDPEDCGLPSRHDAHGQPNAQAR